jgi:hypothetical protein
VDLAQIQLTGEIGPPLMAPEEQSTLARLMGSGVFRYLEFGMGGSTLLAIRSGIQTIVAVDSDPGWVDRIRCHPEIAPRVASDDAAVLHADIGPVGRFGSPASPHHAARWPNYVRVPWIEWESRQAFPELVLVDGRFRVASCLSVVVARSLMGQASADPLVLLHDVVPSRPQYQTVFEYFDVVESVCTLRVMRISRSANPMRALLQLMRAQFDGS